MRARALLLTLGLSFLAACDTSPSDGESNATAAQDDDRGGLGKADLVGTCELPNGEELCDGPGLGNCWCDELCVEYGDCCADADDVCGIEQPEPEGEPCGGWLGDTCDDDEYCAYEPGQHCGAADASATCEDRPELCPEIYAPVCGCDGETYSNSCYAAGAGTGVLHEGECDPGPECDPTLICTQALTCFDGELYPTGCGPANCDEPIGECDPDPEPEECGEVLCALYCEHGFETDENGCEICSCAEGPELPEPTECVVSGCNGEICAAEPMFSPCVALPQFACFDTAECGNFGPEGECGWKQTEELTSCLDAFE